MVRESRHLWIGNLPENIQEDDLKTYFERFGRVQSVKVFVKEKEVKDSVGNVVPTSGISSSSEISATVAFIDIKSANKAHSTKNLLDGRTLKTDYYTPPSASSSTTNVSSHVPEGTTGTNAKTTTTSGPVADPLEKEGLPDIDERSHNQSSSTKAALKRRHSQSVREAESPADSNSQPYSEEEVGASRPNRTATGTSTVSSADSINSNERTHVRTRVTPREKEGSRIASDVDDRERSRGGSPPPSRSSAATRQRISAHEPTSLSRHSSPALPASAAHSDAGSAADSPGRNTREPSCASQEDDSISSAGERLLFEPLSADKRPLAICVRNLPARSSDSSLKDGLFHEYKKYGKIVAVKVQGKEAERHGVICFKRPEDVEKACDMSKDRKFFGASVVVSPHKEPVELVEADKRLKDEEIDEYHQKASRTLYVGELEKGTTIEDLKETFRTFGEVLDADIKRQPNGNAYAFIQFTDIVSVVKALKKMEDNKKVGWGKTMATNCVWCDNLPEKMSERSLSAHFARAGPVKHISINGKKGQALLFFDTVDFAQNAITDLRGKPLLNRRLQLDFASRELQALFFEEMERSGQMSVERKSSFVREAITHNGSTTRYPERETFLPFNDARNHLNNRSAELRHRYDKPRSRRDLAETPRSRNFAPTNGEHSVDSYEREVGYGQRDRRSGRSESPRNKNSDNESAYSEKSEHSSSRRFLRQFSRSPSDSVDERAQRRNSSQSYRRRKSKDYTRTHSAHSPSPSSPISGNEGSDSEGSPVSRQKQRLRQLQNAVMETSGRARGVLKRQRDVGGPRTPDSGGSERATTPDEPPPDSPPMERDRRKSLTAGTIEEALPVAAGQVVAERVVADSNTPEVSSSKEDSPAPSALFNSTKAKLEHPVEMGSDVVTSTVNHAGSPSHADDPSVHSSTESETSKKSETMVSPLPQSISNGPLPDFYQARLNKRVSMAISPAELPLPGFALKKADSEDSFTGNFNDVPTPPSSPRFKTSFHDRMKALDEKFEKISSVTVAMSGIKNRSTSLSEDKSSPVKKAETFMGSNTSPLMVKPEPFFERKIVNDAGVLNQESNGLPQVSNIARYTANPKLTVRSVSTASSALPTTPTISEGKEKVVEVVERSVSKPVTADITAKILSITNEASAKFNSACATSSGSALSTPLVPVSVVPSAKWNGKVEPNSNEGKSAKAENAKTIFFSSAKSVEEVGKADGQGKKTSSLVAPPVTPKSAPVVISDKKPLFKVEPKSADSDKDKEKKRVEEKKAPKSCFDFETPKKQSTTIKEPKIKKELDLFGQDTSAKVVRKTSLSATSTTPSKTSEEKEKPTKSDKEKEKKEVREKERVSSNDNKKDRKDKKEKERSESISSASRTSDGGKEKEPPKKSESKKDAKAERKRSADSVSSREQSRTRDETDSNASGPSSSPRREITFKPAEKKENKDVKNKEKDGKEDKEKNDREKIAAQLFDTSPEQLKELAKEKALKTLSAYADTAQLKNPSKKPPQSLSQVGATLTPKCDKEREKSSKDVTPTVSRESSPQKGLSALAKSAFSAHASAVKASSKNPTGESPVTKSPVKVSSLFSAVDLSNRSSTVSTPKQKSSDSGVDLSKKKKVGNKTELSSSDSEDDAAVKPKVGRPKQVSLVSDSDSDSIASSARASTTSKTPIVNTSKSLSKDLKESLKKATAKHLFPDSDSDDDKKPAVKEPGSAPKQSQQKTENRGVSSYDQSKSQISKTKPTMKLDTKESLSKKPVSASRPDKKPEKKSSSRRSRSASSSSSGSTSDSESHSPSPVRKPKPPSSSSQLQKRESALSLVTNTNINKKTSEVSGSERSEVPHAEPKKRGRKKKVVKTSSESDGSSSDEPPKKNIFEVSLNPEDLMCSMYDKIKRRACTVAKPGASTSRQASLVADEKPRTKEPSKKPTKRRKGSDDSSSSGNDDKDTKYNSQTTASSIDSDEDFGRKKRKSKSPPKKKPAKKEAKKTSSKSKSKRRSSDESLDENESVSDSSSSDSDASEFSGKSVDVKKKNKRGRPRKTDVGSSARGTSSKTKPSSSTTSSKKKHTRSDSSSSDRKSSSTSPIRKPSVQKPSKEKTEKKSEKRQPEENNVKKAKVLKTSSGSEKGEKTKEKEKKESSARSSPEKSKPVEKVKAVNDDHESGFGTYNLSLLMKTSFMESASRESSVASPAEALTPKTMYGGREDQKSPRRSDKSESPRGKMNESPKRRMSPPKSIEGMKTKSPQRSPYDSVKQSKDSSKPHHHPSHSSFHVKPETLSASPSKQDSKESVSSKSSYKPPEPAKRSVPEPSKEKTPEPELVHNLEEEMTAAETLQQIMDNEPLHEAEPIIHIPDEEGDMMTEDERRREAELAASIASIENIPEPAVEKSHFGNQQGGSSGFGKHGSGPEVPNMQHQQTGQAQHPQNIRPHGIPLPIPQPQPDARQREHHSPFQEVQAFNAQKQSLERASVNQQPSPAGQVPPVPALHGQKMQPSPHMQPSPLQPQQQSPSVHPQTRPASEAFANEENAAKRMKKQREESQNFGMPSAAQQAPRQSLQQLPPQTQLKHDEPQSQSHLHQQQQQQQQQQQAQQQHMLQMQQQMRQQEQISQFFQFPQMGFAQPGAVGVNVQGPPQAAFRLPYATTAEPAGLQRQSSHDSMQSQHAAVEKDKERKSSSKKRKNNAEEHLQQSQPQHDQHSSQVQAHSHQQQQQQQQQQMEQQGQRFMMPNGALIMQQHPGAAGLPQQAQQLLMRGIPVQGMPLQYQQFQAAQQQQQAQMFSQQAQQGRQASQQQQQQSSHGQPQQGSGQGQTGADRQNMQSAHQQQTHSRHSSSQHKTESGTVQGVHHGMPSPSGQQPAQKGFAGQHGSSTVPHSPQNLPQSPQVQQGQQQHASSHSDSSRSSQQKPQQPIATPQAHAAHRSQPSNASQPGQVTSVPVIMSSMGGRAMQQIPTSAGIMVSMASTGAPLFIPMPIQQQAQPGQGRPSAIQSTNHSGQGGQRQPQPSPIPMDAATQFALMQQTMNLGVNDARAGAIAKLLQHPHHHNLAEHQKEQQQTQNQAQQHLSQMEKSMSRPHQQLAVPVSFAGIPGVGVEVPSSFLQQFVYSPYGFNPADMAAHQGVMDGRMSVGLDPSGLGLRMAAFPAPFMHNPPAQQRAPDTLHRTSGQENRTSKPSQDKEDRSQERPSQPAQQPRQQQPAQVQNHPPNQGNQQVALLPSHSLVSSLPENLFPPLWDGTLALKNDHAFVRMHYVRGSEQLARMALPAFADMSQNVLKITQRMRLEPTQLENVTRNLKSMQEHCILLACATGQNPDEMAHQNQMLKAGFITYLAQKQAAGIANPSSTNPAQNVTVHVFPPCEFSKRALMSPPMLSAAAIQLIDSTSHLFIVIC